MVISRVLFLSTYETNMSFDDLINNHSLGESVNYVSWSSHQRSNDTNPRAANPSTLQAVP